MKIIKVDNTKVALLAAAVLKRGGLILFPTETTYGAGVDAINPEAVKKLLRYKSRRQGKPLSIAVSDPEMAKQYVEVDDQAQKVWDRFLPGPVTLVAKSKGQVAPGVESEFGTLGLRLSSLPLVGQIVTQLSRPMTATSANSSGKKLPYSIQDVVDNLSERQQSLVDLIIDAGTLPKNPPSTVIDTTLSTPITLRQGGVSLGSEDENLVVPGKPISTGQPQTKSKAATTVTTTSETETKHLAGKIMLKSWDEIHKTGLVLGLNGPLGAGKTIFAKGVAEFLKIKDEVTSPTYTYLEEYDYLRHGVAGKFFHLDAWKIDAANQFARLEFAKLLGPDKVVVVEWWDQVAKYAKDNLSQAGSSFIKAEISDTQNQLESGSAQDTSRQIKIWQPQAQTK